MLDSIWPAGPRELEEGSTQNPTCVRLSNPLLLSVKGRRIKNSCYIYWGGGWRRGKKATPVFDGFRGHLPRLGLVTQRAGSLSLFLLLSLLHYHPHPFYQISAVTLGLQPSVFGLITHILLAQVHQSWQLGFFYLTVLCGSCRTVGLRKKLTAQGLEDAPRSWAPGLQGR